MKTNFKLKLASVVSAVVMLSGMTSVNAGDFPVAAGQRTVAASQPTEALLTQRASDNMYIVRLADPAIATYEGGYYGLRSHQCKGHW
ncbi:MAG: hypothetical protein ACI9WC_003083 [Arenicella sp.]|jgi:hypothetical protein